MRILRRYIFIISILITIALVLYLVAIYVFYQNIYLFLMYRLDFINVIISRRVNIFQISYYAVEIIADSNNQGLGQQFENFDVFPEFLELLNNNDEELNMLRRVLLTPEVKNNMPAAVFDIQYRTVANSTAFLDFGACSGFNYLRKEYLYLVSDTTLGLAQLNSYLNDLNELASIYIGLITISDQDSKSQINIEVQYYIWFSLSCLVFLFALTFVYFIPYFSKERKILENIDMLIKIFIGSKAFINKETPEISNDLK